MIIYFRSEVDRYDNTHHLTADPRLQRERERERNRGDRKSKHRCGVPVIRSHLRQRDAPIASIDATDRNAAKSDYAIAATRCSRDATTPCEKVARSACSSATRARGLKTRESASVSFARMISDRSRITPRMISRDRESEREREREREERQLRARGAFDRKI